MNAMMRFLFAQLQAFKGKIRVFSKFFEFLPISGCQHKILISRLIFVIEIKRIRVN